MRLKKKLVSSIIPLFVCSPFSFLKHRKFTSWSRCVQAWFRQDGSPTNVNDNSSSWSAMNFKYWLYAGTVELPFKEIDLPFGKLSLSTHCSALRHLASFLPLRVWHTACEVLAQCVCLQHPIFIIWSVVNRERGNSCQSLNRSTLSWSKSSFCPKSQRIPLKLTRFHAGLRRDKYYGTCQ